jgi:two-component system, LytTR family, sensor kinase
MRRYPAEIWKELGLHIVLWLAYFCFNTFAYVNYEYNFTELMYIFLWAIPSQVLFIYTTILWSVPRFFLKKKYTGFITVTCMLLVTATFLHRLTLHYGFLYPFRPDLYASIYPWALNPLLRSCYFVLTVSGVFIAMHMVRLSYRQQEINNSLRHANVAAELKNLKEQIKPHFLFNTLNNLYGLTRQNPEKASEVVMRLSQLMSYMLHSANVQKIPVRKDIGYLQDYLELEKIRYGTGLQVSFQCDIENENFQIPPLLLQPFIENAFKHGLSRQLRDAWLQITIRVNENEMNFKVVNSKPSGIADTIPSGIGIANVKKRLELLYPNAYRLKILDEGQTFLVNLTLRNNRGLVMETMYENKMSAY